VGPIVDGTPVGPAVQGAPDCQVFTPPLRQESLAAVITLVTPAPPSRPCALSRRGLKDPREATPSCLFLGVQHDRNGEQVETVPSLGGLHHVYHGAA